MADVNPNCALVVLGISDIIPGVCCLIHHEPKLHGTETKSSVHPCLYNGTDEAICLSPANRLLGSQFLPFLFSTRSRGRYPWKMGASSRTITSISILHAVHPVFTAQNESWTHELPSIIMANDCIFIKPSNSHARPNISPNTFIFTTGHCYSFIATLLVYHSHFTMFFYILLQSVVKCDESRFSMVCVSPWSNHLPSLLKGPSHVI